MGQKDLLALLNDQVLAILVGLETAGVGGSPTGFVIKRSILIVVP